MEIKTCEEYVLKQLTELEEYANELKNVVADIESELHFVTAEYDKLRNLIGKYLYKNGEFSPIHMHSIFDSDDGYDYLVEKYKLDDKGDENNG